MVERKFALFQMLATGVGEVADICPKTDSALNTTNQEVRAFTNRVGLGEITYRNSTVISNSHLQLVISVLTASSWLLWIQLIFSSVVLVPISLKSVLRNCGSSSPG